LVLIDDVWAASTLEDIRKAFPQTNMHTKEGRIIVTTRFPAVATARRGQEGDRVHKVVPLPLEKSGELFEQAHSESKTSEARTIPDEAWKICGGLPLAIVLMAGYVACNAHKHLIWDEIYAALFPDKKRRDEMKNGTILNPASAEAGKDTRKGLTQEELARIVSHCYNDMPAEIITCSLYLGIFPKGSRISRKRLIRRWIAEGFVSEKDGMSVEDVAETYFGHLVRRKMIRPVEHSSSGRIKQCVVHDMVLEHIVSKASEENFITVVGGHWLKNTPSSKVRRLSLQGSDPKRAKDIEKMNLSHVRSLTMFESLKQLPTNSFKFGTIVQVLDLEGCTDLKEQHANEICRMLLLKYLSLRRTDAKELPKTIGKLENLETLDIRETKIVKLPKEVCGLERLVNILGGDKELRRALKLPEEFVKKQKMKGLRTLSGIEIVGELEDLHHLTDLRKLAIYKLKLTGDNANLKLSSSIQYLCGYSLHTLVIHDETSDFFKCLDEMTTPPESLVTLELSGMMVHLPVWITQLYAVTKLTLTMTALRKDNLSKLSNLKTLFSLTFTLAAEKQGPDTMAILAKNKLFSDGQIIIPNGGFENLKLLRLCAPLVPLLIFSEKAMPKLERLEVRFKMLEGIYGAENLASLKEVYLTLNDKDGEVITKYIAEEVRSAVKGVAAKESIARIILHIVETD
jgi:disease resistance protein RPM1